MGGLVWTVDQGVNPDTTGGYAAMSGGIGWFSGSAVGEDSTRFQTYSPKYRSKVRPNGLLLFHDTPWPKVKAALGQLVRMEMLIVVRVIHDFTVCRVTDYQSTEARELLATLWAQHGKTA